MPTLLFRIINRLSPGWGALWKVAHILRSRLGWGRSVRENRPVDAAGNPLPWMTYPALAWLDLLDLAQARVFEYGAGWGTLHWARRCAQITSVESSAPWLERLRPLLPGNATVLGPLQGLAYADAARPGGPWDMVIVDGDERALCAQVAVQVVKPGGLIVLDNADWFPEVAAALRASGLIQVDFQGFGPCNPYTWTTAVFLGPALNLPRLEKPWSGIDLGNIPWQPATAP